MPLTPIQSANKGLERPGKHPRHLQHQPLPRSFTPVWLSCLVHACRAIFSHITTKRPAHASLDALVKRYGFTPYRPITDRRFSPKLRQQ